MTFGPAGLHLAPIGGAPAWLRVEIDRSLAEWPEVAAWGLTREAWHVEIVTRGGWVAWFVSWSPPRQER